MNTKNIIIGAVATLAVIVALFFVYKLVNGPTTTANTSAINVIRPTDNVKWKKNSKNILIEYSDVQCPACRDFYLFMKDFEKSASPDAAYVYRYFPLYQIHPNAFAGAYAAQAAALQGKFWEMESALFEKQPEWQSLPDPTAYFVNLAQNLKLDTNKFKTDMSSQAVKDRVQNDLSEGESIGVNATPTFFLNGQQVNVTSLDEFKKLLLSLK